MPDVNVEALNSAIDVAARESEAKLAKLEGEVEVIREESRVIGVLQKINYDKAHNELLKYAMFFQVRQRKEYKKEGMTWEQFCEAAGENVRNVNRILKDVRPIYEQFQDNLSCFSEVNFNKIKYLGRSFQDNLSQNGELILGGDHIPLTPDNKDEIEAAIDTLIESHKKEQKDLKAKLNKARKNTERIIEEETKGLKAERDALVKEVGRLKEFDPAEKDISWAEEYLSGLKDLVAQFDVGVRRMVMDERLHDAMDVQARCQVFIDTMVRQAKGLQRDWDAQFNAEDL